MRRLIPLALAFVLAPAVAPAADPFTAVSEAANKKAVKLFGSGGFKGVANYGSGILVSPDGLILTVGSPLLDTAEVVVHLHDGRRMRATVLAAEPELEVALLRIKVDGKKPDEPTGLDLACYDLPAAAKRPPAKAGDWVLAFCNQFEIAMRDEPVSVQRGVVAAVGKLSGRRGIFDFPYTGPVIVVDAITNNPGAAGGALTDRDGNLLGLVGREIKNVQTETWVNYAVPVSAKADIREGEKVVSLTLLDFVAQASAGKYKAVKRSTAAAGPAGYHGIVLVPDVLPRTPPYIEDLDPGSPGAVAGLKPNDLVSFVDGEPVASVKAFRDAIARVRPGSTVRLEVRRGDGLQSVEVKLADPPKVAK